MAQGNALKLYLALSNGSLFISVGGSFVAMKPWVIPSIKFQNLCINFQSVNYVVCLNLSLHNFPFSKLLCLSESGFYVLFVALFSTLTES